MGRVETGRREIEVKAKSVWLNPQAENGEEAEDKPARLNQDTVKLEIV